MTALEELYEARARLLADLSKAKLMRHDVQGWQIKATIAGLDIAIAIIEKRQS
jgi:hypothetical protein